MYFYLISHISQLIQRLVISKDISMDYRQIILKSVSCIEFVCFTVINLLYVDPVYLTLINSVQQHKTATHCILSRRKDLYV